MAGQQFGCLGVVALRSLANGAALLDKHPALAQLRLVQALPMGSRVVLTVSDAATGSLTMPIEEVEGRGAGCALTANGTHAAYLSRNTLQVCRVGCG